MVCGAGLLCFGFGCYSMRFWAWLLADDWFALGWCVVWLASGWLRFMAGCVFLVVCVCYNGFWFLGWGCLFSLVVLLFGV